MLVTNVRLENDPETCDLRILDGVFVEVDKKLAPFAGEDALDAGGRLALPPFIESHIHLDTCLTAGQPVWNRSGTLFEGIACWAERKKTLSKKDVKERAEKAVRMMVMHGVQHVRTHVDVTDASLVGIKAMLELRDEIRHLADIQIVAFPQEGIFSYPKGKQLLREALLMGADAVGAIPHFEFTREYSVQSLDYCMKLAEELDKLVDVHCDEIDDPQSHGLETLACRALESGMKERVTASHTTAMHSYDNAYCLRLFRLLKMSDINFVCNPLVNTYLQGRLDTYPRRRGVTRVKELLANGNNVSFGHDDIFDPWYPLGDGNMRDVVHMGLHVCQMMGYDDILQSYKLITHNAARTLNLGDSYGIKSGNPANMIILDAENFYDALNNKSEVLYNIRHGKIIAKAIPASRQLLC